MHYFCASDEVTLLLLLLLFNAVLLRWTKNVEKDMEL